MKRKASGTNPGKYGLMPESVRDAYEQAAVAAWASAQEIAAKSAQNTWQARTLASSGTASAQQPDSEASLYAQVSDADLAAAAAIIVEAARLVRATGILETDLRKSSDSKGRNEVRPSIRAGATAARSRPDS